MNKLIGEIERKKGAEVVKVLVTTFQDEYYVNIRAFRKDRQGEFVPTPRGLTLSTSETAKLGKIVKKALSYTGV